jgi:hypothetical protein
MPDRRGSRFVLEVLFLVGLAVALTLAKLDPLEIGGVMLLGWLIVAILEWAAWRGEAHYGSGLPPRYYVPNVNLPPAQPLEQVRVGYPESHRDEAPTWIASAALRAEVLGDWPHTAPPPEPAPAAAAAAELGPERGDLDDDRWTAVGLPAAPLEEPEPGPDPQPRPAVTTSRAAAPTGAVLARSEQGVARYSLDPLGDPPPRRRFGRGGTESSAAVDVPARPAGPRALPGRANRQE